MRRKPKVLLAVDGSSVPLSVQDFLPAQWPGDSRSLLHDDYARYVAWFGHRLAWARDNLPNGEGDLPPMEHVNIPEMPWDLVEL